MSQHSPAPQFIYGTAWKKEATTQLVKLAVAAGFSAIDTANQPKHYSEPLVGQALLELKAAGIRREQLFLQTKFTSVHGQDARIPYDPTADFATQVQTSFQSSLEHLHTDYIDSYLLHGPQLQNGLIDEDWEIWHAIEKIYESGRAKSIGVSNVNIQQLELLVAGAKIKPMAVQNRCYASQGWDKSVREFCNAHKIMYQGFSLLTANAEVLQNNKVRAIAKRLGKTPEQTIFRFAMQVGMVPLTGTSNERHMQEDLQAAAFELLSEEIVKIENISQENR